MTCGARDGSWLAAARPNARLLLGIARGGAGRGGWGGWAADAGTAGLTNREWEIAGLVAEGLSNREIAGRLVISKRTVDAHIEHIYGKIGVSSRVQLASWLRSVRP
jgi:DNA-binding NarL/FixJ family response regulator